MDDASDASDSQVSRITTLAGIIAFVVIAVFIVASRASPFLFPLLALVALLPSFDRQNSLTAMAAPALPPLSMTISGLAIFGAWLAINASWSLVPATAYGKVALYALFVTLALLAATSFTTATTQFLMRLSRGVLWAAIIFSFYLVIEVIFRGALIKLAVSYFPFLMASTKHIAISDGWVTKISASFFNRNIGAFTMILWPLLLLASSMAPPRRARVLAVALLAIALPTIYYSEHDSSKIALVLSIAIFPIAKLTRPWAIRLVGAGWLIATLLVVPIVFAALSGNLHKSNWLDQGSHKERLILWGNTAALVKDHPILGWGMQSIKPLNARLYKLPPTKLDRQWSRRKGIARHSHNIFLQTWLELGAIGAMLLAGCGLLLLRSIGSLSPASFPYALSAFTTAALMGAFSYGMWQPWFMALFGMSALLLSLGIELHRRRSTEPRGSSPEPG